MHDWRPTQFYEFAVGTLGQIHRQSNSVGYLSEEERKVRSWAKLPPHPTIPDAKIDCDGWIIFWNEHGKHSPFGWQVDHIIPVALGGTDDTSNLRARHWYGNQSAGGRLGNRR